MHTWLRCLASTFFFQAEWRRALPGSGVSESEPGPGSRGWEQHTRRSRGICHSQSYLHPLRAHTPRRMMLAGLRRGPQEEFNPLPYHQVTSTAQSNRCSSAAERLNPDPHFLTSSGPTGVGYPLITGRSQDRNLPSAQLKTQDLHFTGVAQRKRAGLITLRSYDRNVPPVLQDPRPAFLPAWRRGSAQGS